MQRRYWVVIVVLVALVFSATVGFAANAYWRNNRYQLPRAYQSRVLDVILTDHRLLIQGALDRLTAVEARVTSLETRMTAAEANIATNTQNIATNAANIATNTAAIAVNAAAIAANTANITSNRNQISANIAAIAANAAAIAVNAANIASNTARITALEGRMTTAESNITNLQGRMTTAEGNISTNASNITANLTAINSHVGNTTTAHSYDARYVRTSDSTERCITGQRWQGGSTRGSGFTITTNATGDYTINFNTPFSGNTRAVCDVFDGGYVDATYYSNGSLRVEIKDSAGNPVDETFGFAVFGQ